MTRQKVKVRAENHITTYELVEFAVIQLTFYKGKWRFVAVADSTHDDEVHVHQYGRSTFERVGKPEVLMPVTCLADIQTGYDLAYPRIVGDWERNRRRWHDG